MNLRFLEAFLWVARLRSFRRAAERLYTTQAAISSRIATLENEWGVRLFERDHRNVTLTPKGSELLPIAERMLELQQQMNAAVSAPDEYAGTLRVGVMETIVHTWLPALLARFGQRYPRVTIELQSDITPTLRDELLKGRLDCAFMTEQISEGLFDNRHLALLPMHWVAAPSLSLPAGTLPFEEIARFPIISFHKQSVVYRSVVQSATDRLQLHINFFSSLAAMISLLKTGFGIAPLPVAVIRRELAAGELRLLDVAPALPPLPVVACVRLEPASPPADQFLQMAREVCDEFMAQDAER
ncbi:MAG TPA: LysR family transcriptional regulator [Burkholderiaceae bacterium]|nr:LysR family transcriptional regulator [Burkholderiaceae bacterium]